MVFIKSTLMIILTPAEKRFKKFLLSVSPKTFWGAAIHEVLENNPEKIRILIEQLKSQEKDCSEVMENIITKKGVQRLKSL